MMPLVVSPVRGRICLKEWPKYLPMLSIPRPRTTVGEVYVDGFFPRAMLERSNTEFESRAVAFSVIKFNVSWKCYTFTLSSVSCIECDCAATLQKTHSRQESVWALDTSSEIVLTYQALLYESENSDRK